MEVKAILEKMIHLKSIYGACARRYLNDCVTAAIFLREINEHIESHPETAVKYFGIETVEAIIKLCQDEKK